MGTFSIRAGPNTDIWRKPPSTNRFNAPASTPSSLPHTSGPLSTFRSARISFSFAWTEQYDQGGLLLSLHPTSATAPASSAGDPKKWIKLGVEYYNGRPCLGIVACDAWADWSVSQLPEGTQSGSWITLEIERADGELGHSLWVYQVPESGGKKIPLREICWVYGDGDPKEWTVKVEAYAARPEKGTKEELEVQFKDMDVKWSG